MSITITKSKTVESEDIIIQTPFYYKHDLSGDDYDLILYGKITDKAIITIQKTDNYTHNLVSFEIEKDSNPNFQSYSSYLTKKEHQSFEEAFDRIVKEMEAFMDQEAT